MSSAQTAQPLVAQAIDTLAPLMFSLLMAALSWLMVTIQRKLKSETASDMVDRFGKLATTVVLEVEQTVTSSLRNAAKDGTLTLAEAHEAKTQAVNKLRDYLGANGEKEALKVLGFSSEQQLNDFISTQVEAAVARAKAQLGTRLKAELGVTVKESEQ